MPCIFGGPNGIIHLNQLYVLFSLIELTSSAVFLAIHLYSLPRLLSLLDSIIVHSCKFESITYYVSNFLMDARIVFLYKCLFVKILPIRCLRWILRFRVLHKPTTSVAHERLLEKIDTEVVGRLAQVWSSNDFIRSASLPKQACILSEVANSFIV